MLCFKFITSSVQVPPGLFNVQTATHTQMGYLLQLSDSVLLATPGSIMLRAASHHLSTQVAIVILTCPAKYVIVIANLSTKMSQVKMQTVSGDSNRNNKDRQTATPTMKHQQQIKTIFST